MPKDASSMTPLGIPEGSVRAMLALGTLSAAVYMWVTGHEVGDFQKMITTMAVTYYFAARQGTTTPPVTPPSIDLDAVDLMQQVRKP